MWDLRAAVKPFESPRRRWRSPLVEGRARVEEAARVGGARTTMRAFEEVLFSEPSSPCSRFSGFCEAEVREESRGIDSDWLAGVPKASGDDRGLMAGGSSLLAALPGKTRALGNASGRLEEDATGDPVGEKEGATG